MGKLFGDYNADLTVEEVVICELKTSECIAEENEAQLINYLKATTIEVGLLLNFWQKARGAKKNIRQREKAIAKRVE